MDPWYLENEIRKGSPIVLSSKLARAVAFCAFFIFLLSFLIADGTRPHLGSISWPQRIAWMVAAGVVVAAGWRLYYTATAVLEGRRLTLKKMFRPAYDVDLTKIELVKKYPLMHMEHTLVRFRDDNGLLHNALILNYSSIYTGPEMPASTVLKFAFQIYEPQLNRLVRDEHNTIV